MMNKWILGFVAPVLAGAFLACSGESGANDPGASIPQVDTSRVSTATVPPPPPPGSSFTGPRSALFAKCADMEPWTGTSVPPPLSPTFVIALADTDGAPYGFNDGLEVPFPTPWVGTQTTNCPNAAPGHCVADPSVYAYELSLHQPLLHIVDHSFLVFNLVSHGDVIVGHDVKGAPIYAGSYGIPTGARQWFYNGSTTNTTDVYTAVKHAVDTADSSVSAQFLQCVYVLKADPADPTHKLVYENHHAAIAQSHDPINWPE